MAKRPIPQEIGTSSPSLGDAICGEPEKARERCADYANESVIGSDYVATDPAIQGMGRATGQALPGGGLLESVPGFQEIATCGKFVGDVIGGGDTGTARKRWDDHAENSTVGSFCYAIHEDIHGNHKHAVELLKNSGKSVINGTVTAGTVNLTVAAGGHAAPYGVPAAATVGGVAGAFGGLTRTATSDRLHGNVSRGDYVGGALFGGIAGAASGALQAKAYQKVNVAETDEHYLKENEKKMTGKKDATQTLMTYKTEDGTRGGSLGYSARERAKMYEQVKDKDGNILSKHRSANYAGSPSYPKGYDNVSRIFEDPGVQKYLQEHGKEKWPYQNCAEPHAFETIKGNHPGATIDSNYTLGADSGGKITVKGRCKNCKAAGDNYGSDPYAEYNQWTVNDATKARNEEAKAGFSKAVATSTEIVAKAAQWSNWLRCSQCSRVYGNEEKAISNTEDEDEENAISNTEDEDEESAMSNTEDEDEESAMSNTEDEDE